MVPKGKLLIIGGHEEKGDPEERLTVSRRGKSYERFEILRTLISRVKGEDRVIEVITSASKVPEEMEKWYIEAYKKERFENIGFLRMKEKGWDERAYLKRIRQAHAVLFTGGDQIRLVSELKGTSIIKAIKKRYQEDENFILAGTSAGAMSLSGIIILKGLIGEVLYKTDLKLGRGFGFTKDMIVDTHLIQRGRFARLAQAVIQHPECIGVGLSENTALLIYGGNEAECLGSGMVILIDGSKMGVNTGKRSGKDVPMVAENLKVHILTDGCRYFFKDKKAKLMK